jgi:hypothetical protein
MWCETNFLVYLINIAQALLGCDMKSRYSDGICCAFETIYMREGFLPRVCERSLDVCTGNFMNTQATALATKVAGKKRAR